jgi:hypothetical protein
MNIFIVGIFIFLQITVAKIGIRKISNVAKILVQKINENDS